jgi:hypothetical protein
VVLGDPEAHEAHLLDALRQRDGAAERLTDG